MKKTLINLRTFAFASLLLAAWLTSCTDKTGATKTLERSGYKPLNVGGYGWFVGGKEDWYVTKFKAIAPNGEVVTGCVTRGLFKGNTIRLDD